MATQEYINYLTKVFFSLKLVNKLYHWNTTSYPRHVASDRFDGILEDIVDKDGNPVEGFFVANVPVSSVKMESEKFYALGGIAVIIIIAVFINLLDPRLRYFVLRNNNLIRMIGLTLLFCVITIIIVYISRKKLNSDIWYER